MELLFADPQLHPHQSYSGDPGDGTPKTETLTPVTELVATLEHATATAKHHFSSSPSPSLPALASLRNAHRMIGSFLAQFEPQPLPAADGDEPMSDRVVGEEEVGEDEEGDGSRIVDEVEEGIREFALQNKRRKRQALSSWPSGRPPDPEYLPVDSVPWMDRRRSALDLVFQFHG